MAVHVRAPLFDRLVGRDPRPAGEPRPALSAEELGQAGWQILGSRSLFPDSPALRATPYPAHTLSREGLKESVRRELQTLLNTRSALPAVVYLARELTVIDYGIPDLSDFSAAHPEDRARLAAVVRRAVEAFEPRLVEVRVEVAGYDARDCSLALDLQATLVVDDWRLPVSFPTLLGIKRAEARVLAQAAK
jgi:type VI secretion system lysozyme-like protein